MNSVIKIINQLKCLDCPNKKTIAKFGQLEIGFEITTDGASAHILPKPEEKHTLHKTLCKLYHLKSQEITRMFDDLFFANEYVVNNLKDYISIELKEGKFNITQMIKFL